MADDLMAIYKEIREKNPTVIEEALDPMKMGKVKLISFLLPIVKVSEKFLKKMAEEDLRIMAALFLKFGKSRLDKDLEGIHVEE